MSNNEVFTYLSFLMVMMDEFNSGVVQMWSCTVDLLNCGAA